MSQVNQPFIAGGVSALTNLTGLANIPDLSKTTNESSYNFSEAVNSNLNAKNIYVE